MDRKEGKGKGRAGHLRSKGVGGGIVNFQIFFPGKVNQEYPRSAAYAETRLSISLGLRSPIFVTSPPSRAAGIDSLRSLIPAPDPAPNSSHY